MLHQDLLGSVRMATNPDGDVVNNYAFSAYGEQTMGAGDERTLLRYAGEYFVPELGLYFLRARFYDHLAGRFLTPDFYGTDPRQPQSYNPYLYVNANPVRFTDPTGQWSLASVNVAISIMSIIASIALPKIPGPVLAVASALGFQWEGTEAIGDNFAVTFGFGTVGVAGVQLDLLKGPRKFQGIIWFFIGGQLNLSHFLPDPRVSGPTWSWSVGPIYGVANEDPGEPKMGIYVTLGGTVAATLTKAIAARGVARNEPVSVIWRRSIAGIQFEMANSDPSGGLNGGFRKSFSLAMGAWDNYSNDIKAKKWNPTMRGRMKFDIGIALTFYFPLFWVDYTPGEGTSSGNIIDLMFPPCNGYHGDYQRHVF